MFLSGRVPICVCSSEASYPIPTITKVMVSPQSNGTVLITLSGSNFAPQSGLVIDGQVEGTVTSVTSTQLIASVNQPNWSSKAHAIGITSPDGMADQFKEDENNDDHSRSDYHNR